MKKIKGALSFRSTTRTDLERIVRKLAEDGGAIYSTGGTLSFIEATRSEGRLGREPDGLSVDPRRTRQDAPPESFRRHPRPPHNPKDSEQAAQYEIPEIDAVIVDLYPFEQTVASGAPQSRPSSRRSTSGASR